jgi:hypothetical protein
MGEAITAMRKRGYAKSLAIVEKSVNSLCK